MKIICAWCNKTLGYKCMHCNRELEPEPGNPGHLRCPGESGMFSPITFGPTSIAHMQVTHGICDPCAAKLNATMQRGKALTDEDKANLAAQGEN